ncbi:MAG: NUDIX hydrolase [Actinomycetota bacterium]|nr:NUDIX hydrolase [Actinomycetota bacterium]
MALTWRPRWRKPHNRSFDGTIQAAGGAVWRREGGRLEVLLVHRPRYDDWTLPKGKLEGDEGHTAAALREVEEETGLRCLLGPALPTTSHRDRHGRPKVVRYWAMSAIDGRFSPNKEVDAVRWVPTGDAPAVLTYNRDRAVVEALTRAV